MKFNSIQYKILIMVLECGDLPYAKPISWHVQDFWCRYHNLYDGPEADVLFLSRQKAMKNSHAHHNAYRIQVQMPLTSNTLTPTFMLPSYNALKSDRGSFRTTHAFYSLHLLSKLIM